MSGRVDYKPAFSTFAQPKAKSNKTRNIALIGMGLAAAAGITIFVATQNNNDNAQPVATANSATSAPAGAAHGVSADRTKELDETTAKLNAAQAQLAEATPPPAPAVDQGAATTGAPEEQTKPVDHAKAPVAVAGGAKRGFGGGKSKNDKAETISTDKPEAPKAKGAGGEGEDKDFNALLKEAGVDGKKEAKPKLDKKQLSTDEFKKGMAAIASKAQACYKGTQGSANVKLTIAPSGSVSKVTVTGAFAGKPEADCVSAAVKGASFPAWDGGPQSFGYPILLSE